MPCSGKTTILRDLARRISLGIDCRIMRTSVVDERSELSGTYAGISKMIWDLQIFLMVIRKLMELCKL